MFNCRPYSELNREERFFCFLLAHSLLMSPQVRNHFTQLVNSKLGIILDPNNLEVYVEAAALRDYWRDLGDANRYTVETNANRKNVLELILNKFGLPADTLDKDIFWTSAKGKTGKLVSPNRWNIEALERASLENLREIKWAFNAKPDIVLISPATVLFIEAKLESKAGKNKGGYDQSVTLKTVVDLWKLLMPKYSERKFHITTLAVKTKDGITWKDILNLVKNAEAEIDPFSLRCFCELERYFSN